jgi:hypothetical protein
MGGAHKWISRKKWNERKYFLELFFFTGKDTNVRHSWPQLHRGPVTGLLLSWYGMVWYGIVWFGKVWYGIVWYGMVWYGLVWFGMVWYGEHQSEHPKVPALPPHDHHMLHSSSIDYKFGILCSVPYAVN